MNAKNVVLMIVSAIVGLILITAVATPIIVSSEDSTKSKVYHQNVGIDYYNFYQDNVSFSYDFTSKVYTLNEEVIPIDAYTNILVSENLCVYALALDSIAIEDYVNHTVELVGTGTISFVMDGGVYTLITPSKTYNGSSSEMYCYSGTETGDYSQVAQPGIVNANSNIVVKIGDSFWTKDNACISIDDPLSGSTPFGVQTFENQTYVETLDTTLSWTITDNEDGSYVLSLFVNSNSNVTMSPISVLVPTEYYELVPTTSTTLITILPILLVVGLLIGVVGTFIYKRF